MRSTTPKVLFDVCGMPSIIHVLETARSLGASRLIVVVGVRNEASIRKVVDGHFGESTVSYVLQDPAAGTGHAVRLAFETGIDKGEVVILYGDGPLYSTTSLRRVLTRHREGERAATLLTATVDNPTGYGRIVSASEGREGVAEIVEELDAQPEVRRIQEINTGVMVLDAEKGLPALRGIRNDNAKGEFYLTDVVGWLVRAGFVVDRVEIDDPLEAASFNSIEELADVRRLMRRRINREHMQNGVDIVDPETAYIDVKVEIGAGTQILPSCVIASGVRIGPNCQVGPFAHLREGTVLDEGVAVGNFTEIKKSHLGAGVKAKHLTYLGNATIGARTNIGCGTIVANYDGKAKHPTTIGANVFIGSGTILISPVNVGDGAMTGAGAVVRAGDVAANEVVVGVPARLIERKRDQSKGEAR